MLIYTFINIHLYITNLKASTLKKLILNYCFIFMKGIFSFSSDFPTVSVLTAMIAQLYNTGIWAGQLGFYSLIPGRGWEFFPLPLRPEWFWAPPSLLSNEYEGLFPWGQSDRGVKLTTHLHLVPRSKNEWSYTFIPPICLHGVVLS
jgi:hypothetical protein